MKTRANRAARSVARRTGNLSAARRLRPRVLGSHRAACGIARQETTAVRRRGSLRRSRPRLPLRSQRDAPGGRPRSSGALRSSPSRAWRREPAEKRRVARSASRSPGHSPRARTPARPHARTPARPHAHTPTRTHAHTQRAHAPARPHARTPTRPRYRRNDGDAGRCGWDERRRAASSRSLGPSTERAPRCSAPRDSAHYLAPLPSRLARSERWRPWAARRSAVHAASHHRPSVFHPSSPVHD